MSQLNSDVSDPKLRSAQFGPSQIGIAVGAVIFGLVFVLVSGGDFLPNNRYKGVRAAREPPDAVEEGIIKGRIAQLEQALQADANDTEALQALALSYAQLFNFDKAAGLLDKLTARQPNNADAWRVSDGFSSL
jgi:tetratricopeptide (TPR) repeat protein